MTTYTTIANLPLPEDNTPLVAERTFGDFATALDTQIVPQYTTTAVRDAAMISGITEGQVCTVAGELMMWDGTAWWGTQDVRYVTKASDTSRATSTTSADPHLVISVKSGGTYVVNCYTSFVCANAAINVNALWTTTGGAVVNHRTIIGIVAGTTNKDVANAVIPGSSTGTAVTTGAPNNTGNYRLEILQVTATSDGTLAFNWAQDVTNATVLTLQQRSFIEYRRVS